jgi:hypothetical protein
MGPEVAVRRGVEGAQNALKMALLELLTRLIFPGSGLGEALPIVQQHFEFGLGRSRVLLAL